MRVFDVSGRLVATLVDRPALDAGTHTIHWDLRDQGGQRVQAGVYLVRLRTESSVEIHHLSVLR